MRPLYGKNKFFEILSSLRDGLEFWQGYVVLRESKGAKMEGSEQTERPFLCLKKKLMDVVTSSRCDYVSKDWPSAVVCKICNHPFENPMKTNCDHTFCRDCIYASTRACPLCRSQIGFIDVDNSLYDLLGQLEVYCPSKDKGIHS